jgi:starvation-inducible DNA-binding protein
MKGFIYSMGNFPHVKQVPDERTTKIIRMLNKQLADTLDLRSQIRESYFNVNGPYDQELRSLFDGLALELWRFTNLTATSIQDLGGYAVATVRSVAAESSLRDYPADVVDARDHLGALLSAYSRYELNTRYNMKAIQELGGFESVALLQVVLGSVENNLWFLEAYWEGIAIGLHGRKLPVWTSALSNQPRLNQNHTEISPYISKY